MLKHVDVSLILDFVMRDFRLDELQDMAMRFSANGSIDHHTVRKINEILKKAKYKSTSSSFVHTHTKA